MIAVAVFAPGMASARAAAGTPAVTLMTGRYCKSQLIDTRQWPKTGTVTLSWQD
jgi:hypothetical protein